MKNLNILGIDTSCDETSVSVIRDLRVLSNVMPSQIEFHKKYGGVVPSIAKLAHTERIDSVVNLALKRAKLSINDINLIAVTYGPGLAIALEVGINKAKELAIENNIALIKINHMEGHMLSSFVKQNTKLNNLEYISELNNVKFPSLGVLVSGNHTELIKIEDFGKYEKIGESLDDASGEAFDKCGRMLGLGYPAGPVIAKFAKENRKNIKIEIIKKNQSVLVKVTNIKSLNRYTLPIPMINSDNLNFSYSGLKTSFNQLVNSLNLTSEVIKDLSVLVEYANTYQVAFKVEKALKMYNFKEVWLGGGVVANITLRKLIRDICKKNNLVFRVPFSNKVTGDNAAMIAVTSYIRNYRLDNLKQNPNILFTKEDILKIDRDPSLSL